MERKSISQARKDFAEIVNKVRYGNERAIIEKHGKDCVAIIPITDLKILERIEDFIDLQDAEKALKEAEEKGTIPFEQVLKEAGLSNE